MYNKFFKIVLILIFFLLTIIATTNYQGNKIIYITYSLFAGFFFLRLTNKKTFFFENFLAFYFLIGYWLGFAIKISFFESNFIDYSDGYGVFDFRPESFDEVLIVCITFFCSFIFSSYIREKYINFDQTRQNIKTIKLSNSINYNYIYFLLFIILFLLSLINLKYGLYQRSVIINYNLNPFIANFFKWFLIFGYLVFFSFLIYFALKSKNPLKHLAIYFYLICEFFISLSILSRGMIFNGFAILWGIIKTFKNINLKSLTFSFILLIILFSLNIFLVEKIRLNAIGNKTYQTIETIENSDNQKIFSKSANKLINIIVSRMHGFEAIMAVQSIENKSFSFLLSSFTNKTKPGEPSFFDKIKNDNRQKEYSNDSITIPGLIAFLYYSNSLIFIFTVCMILYLFFCIFEKFLLKISYNNLIFSSVMSHFIVYRLWHFGHNPSNSYLFLISILLCCILIFVLNKFIAK